jgi:hypothetical protein
MKSIITLLTIAGLATFSFSAEGDAKKAEGKGGKGKMNPEEAFKKLDKDGNGSVSKEEYMASPQAKKDAAKAEESFGKRDKNKDGSLSKDEFMPKKKAA